MSNGKRIEWIDNTKAFACFLVVLGHLLMSLRAINSFSGVTEFIIWFIYLFHMPLFMCISGFLYFQKEKIDSLEQYKKFEIKKFINLIIPYITFYMITIFLNYMFSNSVNNKMGINELSGIINKPIPPYWFLYSLLCIFIFVPIIEKKIKDKRIIMTLFVILKVIHIFYSTNIFIIDTVMSNGIYYYFGSFIQMEKNELKKSVCYVLLSFFLLISLIIYIFIYNKYTNMCNLLSLFLGLFGSLLFINIFKNLKTSIFKSYKKYTFQIFLLHTIFAAGIRIILYKLGITSFYIHLAIGLIVSIYLPVCVSIVSNKIKYTNFFFYPLKTLEELKKGK